MTSSEEAWGWNGSATPDSHAGEAAFEAHITAWLVDHGRYRRAKLGNASGESDFDGVAGLDTADLFEFIGTTQAEQWKHLVDSGYGGDETLARAGFVQRLASQLDKLGTVKVLRQGVVDYNVTVRLAFFKPAHGLTPELVDRYEANVLSVTRQLRYEPGSNKTIDLALFVNGVPVATAELKNPLTGQNVEHAILQYRKDRDPEQPDPAEGGDGSLRNRSVLSIHDHPSGGEANPVPAVQPGPRSRSRQPAQPGRAPHRLPVGAGVVPGRVDGHPGPLHPRREDRRKVPRSARR